MAQTHVLVTGALGCIGAWVVRNLVQEGTQVTAYDLETNPFRLALIMTPEELARVTFAQGDITDLRALEALVKDSGVTDIIHLAALQVPACKANPVLGARVNVVGSVNVFEAALRAGLQRVVYASSVAVYGPPGDYPAGLITHDALLRPRTLYGVYKQANEATARLYFQDYGLSSLALRPYVLYGAGRDQGMTSTPTKAMLAAAAGQPYHITYGGRAGMQYTDDIARIFIRLTRTPFKGAEVYNVQGSLAHMSEVVAAIEKAAPAVRGKVTYDPAPLPFPEGQDDRELQALLGGFTYTPLEQGVAQTIAIFRTALEAGRISYQG